MSDGPDSEQPETDPDEESTIDGKDSMAFTEEETVSDDATASTQEAPAEEKDRDEWERELDKRERRLDERELGLDTRAEKLDEREQELDEREQELDKHQEELAEEREELQEWETDLEQRQETLDDRENELDEFEQELQERARQLREHEETLHNYIDGQVEDLEESMQNTILSILDTYEDPGRFGPTGNLLIGLAGLVLVAAGVGYGAAIQFNPATGLFGGAVTDLAVAAALLIIGLAINLVTAADRV